MGTRKTYVEFLYQGIFQSESSSQEVKNRDIKNLCAPGRAYAFKFYDILEIEEDDTLCKSGRLDVSPAYFLGGRILTLKDVRREMPTEKILISNMSGNGYARVVMSSRGTYPMSKGDVLLERKNVSNKNNEETEIVKGDDSNR